MVQRRRKRREAIVYLTKTFKASMLGLERIDQRSRSEVKSMTVPILGVVFLRGMASELSQDVETQPVRSSRMAFVTQYK